MRNAVLLCVFVISCATTAFGDEVWYYTVSYSGWYTGSVIPFDDWPPYPGSWPGTLVDRGGCSDSIGAVLRCGVGGYSPFPWTGGVQLPAGGSAYFDYFNYSPSVPGMPIVYGQVNFNLNGTLFIPGTGTTDAVFDVLYGWQAIGLNPPRDPVFSIDDTSVSLTGTPGFESFFQDGEYRYLSSTYVATVERGIPVPFTISYNANFGGSPYPPHAWLNTYFGLEDVDGIAGTPGYFAPEPSTGVAVCVGTLAIAAAVWRKRLFTRNRPDGFS